MSRHVSKMAFMLSVSLACFGQSAPVGIHKKVMAHRASQEAWRSKRFRASWLAFRSRTLRRSR